MTIEEIRVFLDENKDNQDVVNFITSLQKPLSRDVVEKWCQDGEGQSWLDRNCDLYSKKAIETARTNAIEKYETETLPAKIEEALKAKSDEGLTPEQVQLRELQKQLDDMKFEKEKVEKLNANTNTLKEKNLPLEFAPLIKGDADITLIESVMVAAIKKAVEDKLGSHDETPPAQGGTPVQKMSLTEIMKYANQHPEINIQDLINQNK